MTPAEIKEARKSLGLTQPQFGSVLRFGGKPAALQVRVSEIERGAQAITAERAELLRAYLSGYRCDDWPSP